MEENVSDAKLPRRHADQSAPLAADQLFSFECALKRIPGGMAMVRKMIPVMVRECESSLEEIREGLAAEDAKQVQRAAHTISGSGDIFGATQVVEAARAVERAGRDGELQRAAEMLGKLVMEVNRLCEAITATSNDPVEPQEPTT